jgi:hypothetical protein
MSSWRAIELSLPPQSGIKACGAAVLRKTE